MVTVGCHDSAAGDVPHHLTRLHIVDMPAEYRTGEPRVLQTAFCRAEEM